jgi:hypothetical protein
MKKILVLALMLCLSGCLERIGQIDRNLKPYGAHWVKEGMTRNSRRNDLIACGSPRGEVVEFSLEQINMEKVANEPNGAAAYLRLRDRVGACMQSKGYQPIGDLQYLGGCDARCLYP